MHRSTCPRLSYLHGQELLYDRLTFSIFLAVTGDFLSLHTYFYLMYPNRKNSGHVDYVYLVEWFAILL